MTGPHDPSATDGLVLDAGDARLVVSARGGGRITSLVAGAAAGVVPGILDPIFFYPEWTTGWKVTYLVLCMLSSGVVAGLGSHALAARLARTGVLDAFPVGRERAST